MIVEIIVAVVTCTTNIVNTIFAALSYLKGKEYKVTARVPNLLAVINHSGDDPEPGLPSLHYTTPPPQSQPPHLPTHRHLRLHAAKSKPMTIPKP